MLYSEARRPGDVIRLDSMNVSLISIMFIEGRSKMLVLLESSCLRRRPARLARWSGDVVVGDFGRN